MSGSQADISQCNRCRKQKPGDKYPFQSCRWDKCYSALANCVRALQRARYFPSFAFRFEPNVPLCCLYSKFPWTWEFPPLTALRSVHKLVRPKGSRIAPTIHFLTTNVTIHAVRVRGGVLLVLILYKAPHSQVWVPESHSMNPPIAVLAPRLAVETGKSHPLWPLVFDFACTTADLAGASASSAAFFAITYWIISDEYFTSAMTWKARGRSLAVTSGTHFF
jgi:hypothetical protein